MYMSSPKLLFVEITGECNLNCGSCHMWMDTDSDEVLGLAHKLRIIKEYKLINPEGTVIFTGGEPFLKYEELLTLSQCAKDCELVTVVNTNGVTFPLGKLQDVLFLGPEILVISLDSNVPSVHDFMRGNQGVHQQLLANIRDLILLRDSLPSHHNNRIVFSSILCDLNLESVFDFIRFTKDIGVDALVFQMLIHTFSHKSNKDTFFERYWFKDISRARFILQQLQKDYSEDPFISHTFADFEYMIGYLDSPNALKESICCAHERNVMVDRYGYIRLCHNMDNITGATLGNVKSVSLKEALESSIAQRSREFMKSCNKTCGMLNCYRKY